MGSCTGEEPFVSPRLSRCLACAHRVLPSAPESQFRFIIARVSQSEAELAFCTASHPRVSDSWSHCWSLLVFLLVMWFSNHHACGFWCVTDGPRSNGDINGKKKEMRCACRCSAESISYQQNCTNNRKKNTARKPAFDYIPWNKTNSKYFR